MFDIVLDYIKNIIKSRILPLLLVYVVLFSTLVYRIFELQIMDQEEIVAENEKESKKEREIKATRGNIYDCNGVLLAYNELSYTITLEDVGAYDNNDDRNAMLHRLIQIIEENGGSLATEFYIRQNKKGELQFTVSDNAELRFKKNAYAKKSVEELTEEERNATASEVYEHLRQGTYMFGISDEYSVEDTLKIMNIRYAMFMNTYAKYLPISISTDVDDRTVAAIKENSPDLPGVEIVPETHRVYNDSVYFAHILGYTGMINETELENDEADYYSVTDQIGKTGLERAFEEQLRGVKGGEEVSLNSSYRVVSVEKKSDPVAGSDLYLTIDSELQKAGYHILEKNIAAILLSRIKNSATAGNTKDTTASDLNIPIYDVYYALINNNIIDVTHFQSKKATDLEKSVYALYQNKEASILKGLKGLLKTNSTVTFLQASTEMQDYLVYLYDYMQKVDFLMTSAIDETDSTYLQYQNNAISLSQFLQYAISMNWVNLDLLDIGDSYYDTEELYQLLLDRVFSEIVDDSAFHKMIYSTLVYSYQLSGRDICLLLFDQKIIKKNKKDRAALENGTLSAYQFIRNKIQSLEITPAQLALDPCSGSLVVTDPDTGVVRAMVTYPSYDNMKLANRIDADYYNILMNDLSLPMINRPIQQKTAPGSTFKPISAVAALEEGVVGEYETIHDDVTFEKVGTPVTCWTKRSHGDLDTRHAIEVSCNCYFYETAYRLSLTGAGNYNSGRGLTKLNQYAAMFGFKEGETTGIELYEYEPDISNTDSIRSSIGQARYAFTPTQIARYISTVANGGTCRYLTLIDRIVSIEGEEVENTISVAKTEKAQKVSLQNSTWDAIKDGMYLALNGEDSAYLDLFEDLKVTVAGKTGTAQIVTQRGNHALFTSYAPYDDPEITLTVVIPYAYTSTNATKAASDFYHYYYGSRDLEEVMESKVDADNASYSTRVTN